MIPKGNSPLLEPLIMDPKENNASTTQNPYL